MNYNSIRVSPLLPALAASVYLFCGANPASAHLPELFGHEYVRVTGGLIDKPSSVVQVAPPPLAPEEVDAFRGQVQDSERSGGPYADGLTEPLTSLGLHHRIQGDHAEAIKAYQRALHVARVNDGLTSDRQVPILRELISLYRENGNFASLEGVYVYYARVQSIGGEPTSQQDLDDGLEYIRWQREAYTMRSDGKKEVHLLEAYLANKEMIDALVNTPAPDREWYRHLVLSQMHNLYLLLSAEPVTLHDKGFVPGQLIADEATRREIQYIQKSAVTRGQDLLRDLIERTPDFNATDRAAMHLELGDWYQWHGKFTRAGKEYATVVQILRDAGNDELLAKWLDQPMELPDEAELWQRPSNQENSTGLVVVAQYKVSARGEAKSIRVSVPGVESSSHARKISTMLRETHFRPRFSQGIAERSEPVTRTYRLLD